MAQTVVQISVRERIAREIRRRMAGIPAVNNAHRHDERRTDYEHQDVVVGCGQERVNRGESNISITQKTLPVVVSVELDLTQSTENTDELVNGWLQKLIEPILEDERLTDPDGVSLAFQCIPQQAGGVRRGRIGETRCAARVQWDVIYSHARENVAQTRTGDIATETE